MSTLVQQAHAILAKRLRDGDVAIDATVGNGHDTAFLANAVGPSGRVYGFDVQQAALDASWQRLDRAGLSERVTLFHAGHETMALHLPHALHGQVQVVMFNLGYLPGSDKQCRTGIATSISALQQAVEFLAEGGLLSIMAYTGHPGGTEEAAAVRAWVTTLPARYHAALLRPQGTRVSPPEWWLVQG
ncbi:MAG: 16S rRNA (cytosine(1402)-N(4))-methyltransferase [Chromatiales bacterium]|nr:16S rRNA (cytosine(1402)-N(4))-methyltransferase [Gammaproteobacteria bacterium]MBW6477186.1 16S rRNA (cytosine(1402)-N(4))-methyltransferase [Chromatiales bacterium]